MFSSFDKVLVTQKCSYRPRCFVDIECSHLLSMFSSTNDGFGFPQCSHQHHAPISWQGHPFPNMPSSPWMSSPRRWPHCPSYSHQTLFSSPHKTWVCHDAIMNRRCSNRWTEVSSFHNVLINTFCSDLLTTLISPHRAPTMFLFQHSIFQSNDDFLWFPSDGFIFFSLVSPAHDALIISRWSHRTIMFSYPNDGLICSSKCSFPGNILVSFNALITPRWPSLHDLISAWCPVFPRYCILPSTLSINGENLSSYATSTERYIYLEEVDTLSLFTCRYTRKSMFIFVYQFLKLCGLNNDFHNNSYI